MSEEIRDTEVAATELSETAGVRIRLDEPLSTHCTFRIGGPAEIFAEVDTLEGLSTVQRVAREHRLPFHLLGLGSNVLFPDAGLPGLVVRMAGDFRAISVDGDQVRAGAAVSLAQLAQRTARSGLVGLEALAGFPSTVGGAVFMNAGCYGTEIKDVLVSAEALTAAGERRVLAVDELEPRYRETNLKSSGAIVTSAHFSLREGSAEETVARLDELNRKRWKSLPSGKPNAGSIFKNPPGDTAGRMIDECGLKGESRGGAQISPKHGNVIVNNGGARAAEVLELMLLAHDAVVDRFGVRLEPEIVLCGPLVGAWRQRAAAAQQRAE